MNSRLFSNGTTLIKKSNLFVRNIGGTNNKKSNNIWFGFNLYEIGDLIQEPPENLYNNGDGNTNKGNKQFDLKSNSGFDKENESNKIKLLDIGENTKDFPLL